MEAVIAGLSIMAVVLVGLVVHQTRKSRGLRDLVAQTTARSEEALTSKELELAELRDDRDRRVSRVSELETENSELRTDGSSLQADISSLQADISSLRDGATAANEEAAALRNQVKQLESVIRLRPKGDDLWGLELMRSERTWRISVATSPDGESPFTSTDDPLRLAIEIEAAALREDVGAYTSIRWEATTVDDPIRSLRILRVSQELLSEAARDPRPVELVVSDHGDQVHLLLINPSDPTSPIELGSTVASSEHIEVSDSDGLIVVS